MPAPTPQLVTPPIQKPANGTAKKTNGTPPVLTAKTVEPSRSPNKVILPLAGTILAFGVGAIVGYSARTPSAPAQQAATKVECPVGQVTGKTYEQGFKYVADKMATICPYAFENNTAIEGNVIATGTDGFQITQTSYFLNSETETATDTRMILVTSSTDIAEMVQIPGGKIGEFTQTKGTLSDLVIGNRVIVITTEPARLKEQLTAEKIVFEKKIAPPGE